MSTRDCVCQLKTWIAQSCPFLILPDALVEQQKPTFSLADDRWLWVIGKGKTSRHQVSAQVIIKLLD